MSANFAKRKKKEVKNAAAREQERRQRFPELYRSDVSIQPSYTGLLTLPYDVICRLRLAQRKRQYIYQMKRELDHIIAMKMQATDGIRLDLFFSTR